MNDSIEEKKVGDYLIKIFQDNDSETPRSWDNIGSMVCFNRKYNLGDTHDYDKDDYSGWSELKESIIKKEKVAAILPLFLYDHSGITIKTTPFSCPWDSGQIGFIFVSKEKALKEFDGKIVTEQLKEKLIDQLKGEVETYDQYLSGDVYGYQISKDDKEIDGCWGYYGLKYCLDEAEKSVMFKSPVVQG